MKSKRIKETYDSKASETKWTEFKLPMQIQTRESLSPTLNLASVIIQNINIFCNTAMNYQDEHPYYLVSHSPLSQRKSLLIQSI